MRNQGGRVIVNVSQQGDWGTPDNPLDKAIYAANETKFLNNTATMLNNLPDNQLSQMVFVVASGNGASNNLSNGVDLCNAIGQLHIQFPRVFTLGGGPHMIIVGGTNGGSKDTGANYSSCDLSSDGTPPVSYTHLDVYKRQIN